MLERRWHPARWPQTVFGHMVRTHYISSCSGLGNTPLRTASIEILCIYCETVFILSTLYETKVCTRYACSVSSGMASPVLPRYLGRESKEPLFPNYFWVVAKM